MDVPRDLHINLEGDEFTFRIGDHDLSDLVVMESGPIIECLMPGLANPAYVAWVPFMFEGNVDDPKRMTRIVREGEATTFGLPDPEGD